MGQVTFHLEVFDGPLDLLLHLLSKNRIEIRDIPIADILRQYLDYLEEMRRMDIEVTADFIAMASQLIYIKSKMLLPVYEDDESEDPRSQLVKALLDYQMIKQAAGMLMNRYETGKDMYPKPPEARDRSFELFGNTAEQLKRAMAVMLERKDALKALTADSFTGIVGKEAFPVSKKIYEIAARLERVGSLSFKHLLFEVESRSELVAVFLAVLELSRDEKIIIKENGEELMLMLGGDKQDG